MRTPESDYLLAQARRVSDHYSDLDLTVYYDGELPTEEDLARIREQNGAPERVWLLGDRAAWKYINRD